MPWLCSPVLILCTRALYMAVVEQSSDVNLSQLCGTEDREVIVPSFDWTTFLARFFRKVVSVKKFHHFHFEEGSTTLRVQ